MIEFLGKIFRLLTFPCNIYPSILLFSCNPSVYLSFCISIYISIYLSIYRPSNLFKEFGEILWTDFFLVFDQFLYSSIYISIYQPINLFTGFGEIPQTDFFICLSIYLSIHLSIYLFLRCSLRRMCSHQNLYTKLWRIILISIF